MPNTELVRRAHEALNNGDLDALVALCEADFRLDMSDRVLNPAVYEGEDGIRRFYAEVTEVWETFTWRPVELHDLDDLIVVVLHASGKGRGSGLELDRKSAMVWRVANDRLVALTFYRDPEDAFTAAESGRLSM